MGFELKCSCGKKLELTKQTKLDGSQEITLGDCVKGRLDMECDCGNSLTLDVDF